MQKKLTYKWTLQKDDPSSFGGRQEAGPQIWEGGLGCPAQEQAATFKIIFETRSQLLMLTAVALSTSVSVSEISSSLSNPMKAPLEGKIIKCCEN